MTPRIGFAIFGALTGLAASGLAGPAMKSDAMAAETKQHVRSGRCRSMR